MLRLILDEGIEPDEGGNCPRVLIACRKNTDCSAPSQGRILREGVGVIYGATNATISSAQPSARLRSRHRQRSSGNNPRARRDGQLPWHSNSPDRYGGPPHPRLSDQAARNRAHRKNLLSWAICFCTSSIATRPRPDRFPDRLVNSPSLLVLNKSDLPEHGDWEATRRIADFVSDQRRLRRTGRENYRAHYTKNLRAQSAVAINTRHRDCLRRAQTRSTNARAASAEGTSPEYFRYDLNAAISAIGEVIGEVDTGGRARFRLQPILHR